MDSINKVTGLTQATGSCQIDVPYGNDSKDRYVNHQITIKTSATPSAGTITVKVIEYGQTVSNDIADDSGVIPAVLDLTTTIVSHLVRGALSSFVFELSSFDADKTVDITVNSFLE